MTKTELVKALMDAGLAPQDLQDEYCHAQAAARNKELEVARDKLAACIVNYKHVFAGDRDKLTPDIGRTEKFSVIEDLKNMESTIKQVKPSKELDSPLSALDMFIKALDH